VSADLFNAVTLRLLDVVDDGNLLFQVLDVFHHFTFLMLVNDLHGCLEQAACKSTHVSDWAVNEEFFDDLLVGEGLDKPRRQRHILKQRFANHADKERNLGSHVEPERAREAEGDDEFEYFELVITLPKQGNCLQVLGPRLHIICIRHDDELCEDLMDLVDKLLIVDELGKPEASVLLQNGLVNSWRNLDLRGDCLWQAALLEELG